MIRDQLLAAGSNSIKTGRTWAVVPNAPALNDIMWYPAIKKFVGVNQVFTATATGTLGLATAGYYTDYVYTSPTGQTWTLAYTSPNQSVSGSTPLPYAATVPQQLSTDGVKIWGVAGQFIIEGNSSLTTWTKRYTASGTIRFNRQAGFFTNMVTTNTAATYKYMAADCVNMKIYYSSNLTSWAATAKLFPEAPGGYINALKTTNGKTFTFSREFQTGSTLPGYMYVSTDGATWTKVDSPAPIAPYLSSGLRDIEYNGSDYVLVPGSDGSFNELLFVGSNYTAASLKTYSSNNSTYPPGSTWGSYPAWGDWGNLTNRPEMTSVIWTGSNWLICGARDTNQFLFSTDGDTWSLITRPTFQINNFGMFRISEDNKNLLCFGPGGLLIATS